MKFGLKKEVLDQLKSEISKIEDIDKALIFGSRSIGNFKEGSDIDIAILGDGLNIDHILKLQNMIDDLDLPFFIDIVIYHKIKNSKLLKHIEKYGNKIYERNEKLAKR